MNKAKASCRSRYIQGHKTYLYLARFGGHARHILPPLSPPQPVIADEEIRCWGTLPKLFHLFAFSFSRPQKLVFHLFPFMSYFVFHFFVTSDERGLAAAVAAPQPTAI